MEVPFWLLLVPILLATAAILWAAPHQDPDERMRHLQFAVVAAIIAAVMAVREKRA